MKKIFLSALTFICTATLFVSCELNNANEGDYDGTNPRSGWIEFVETSNQVLNTAGRVTIPVDLQVDINDTNTQFDYSIEVIDGDGTGVQVGTFTDVVPANTLEAIIEFDVDASISTTYTLKFTILSTSNPEVIVGLEGDNPIEYELLVCANVFPLAWTGNAFIDGTEINTFDMTLTETGNPGEYTISSAWGTNFVAEATGNPDFDGQFIYDGTFTLTSDNVVTIVGSDPSLFPGTVSNDASTNGNQFDPCTGTLTYTLQQALFGGDFVVDVILTPTP